MQACFVLRDKKTDEDMLCETELLIERKRMQKIIQNIKEGSLKQVYLLYGPEDYLRKQYRDKLADALGDRNDTLNFHSFEGKDFTVEKLIDLGETFPFLASRKTILVENSGLFKSSQEKLADYLEHLPQTTFFLFVEKEVDKRGKLYKTCSKVGYCCEFNVQNEETLKRWIVGRIHAENKQVTQRALDIFLDRCGCDMETISGELEKLLCYTLDKEDINQADVEAICTRQIASRIFDMIEAIALKRQSVALDLYYDLIALKEPPRRILYLITRQFHMLFQTKLLRQRGHDEKSIASKIGIQPFVAKKYMNQASRFTVEQLREAIEECVRAEESINTGKIAETLCVELLIIRFSKKE